MCAEEALRLILDGRNEPDEEMADAEEYDIEGAGYNIEMRNTVHVVDNDGDIEVFSEHDDADDDVEEELQHRAAYGTHRSHFNITCVSATL